MELKDCDACFERRYVRAPVPGEGNKNLAETCLLGRNPGRQEDHDGRPFIGRAGKKLDEGLIFAGIQRYACYITNVSKCMTPTGVTPSVKCRAECTKRWLDDELASLEKLKLVVAFGNEALQYFEPLAHVGELHGLSFMTHKPWSEGKIKIFVSFHPSAALRSATIDKYFREDMEKLRNDT